MTQQKILSQSIKKHVPLHTKNWFGTGGVARLYTEPTTALEFQDALLYAQATHLNLFILGQGANVLISDDGFDGLVIKPQLKTINALDDEYNSCQVIVTAGAGVTLSELIEYCLDNGITGLEEFSGIPGSVGGSTFINLHYFEFLLDQFLISAQVVHKKTGTLSTVAKEWFQFGYNSSQLHTYEHYLVSASFALKKATPLEVMYARGRRAEIIRHRLKRYPSVGTCGSFFRNFYDSEVTIESNGIKMIFVAYYLDKIGVKGSLKHGNAIVSHQHANMIVNQGSATSTDIIIVARTMQELVYKDFGIIPQPECQLIGFKTYPLLL